MDLSMEVQGRNAAENFRDKHGLGQGALGDLISLINQTTGHDVAVIDADEDEHGLAMTDPLRERVFVGVAKTNRPMRQRSTLAHELAHLVFADHSENLAERKPLETRADAFARHLLIPQQGLKQFLGEIGHVEESHLSQVVQHFLVSPPIAAIALREAGFIGDETKSEWMRLSTPFLATKFGWRDFYAALQLESSKRRAPQGLVARAVRGYMEGVLNIQVIATLQGRSENDVLAEFDNEGIFPRSLDLDAIEFDDLPELGADFDGNR
ncbi:hypothetical protein N24_2597 [Corynebacterium suranareeae]|uniref:IrrE N-terminal-like domain-containing protein n=1 Tax=Corynebacterium suranareeae TaxID=2506452 RepID=A0A160PRV8_9CORY|nr:ImmA/IrrE family metallo-endopeptidase [Corynebacterium suranareeae]BAU96859.1 hypothetical protein N24_2597 [Corynebacterium suranareeae]